MKQLEVMWIRERFQHMGLHSGYDQLCKDGNTWSDVQCQSILRDLDQQVPFVCRKILNQLIKRNSFSPGYEVRSAYAELRALLSCVFSTPDIVHVSYIENNLGFLDRYSKKFNYRLLATVHQPSSWWRLSHPHPESVSKLDALIVLAKSDIDYFDEFLPGKVHFIPHGVDTSFFHPKTDNLGLEVHAEFPRCVFSGAWLRDLDTLSIIIDKLLKINEYIHFDLIIPLASRNRDSLYRLASHERVKWHANLSDENLRNIYQDASLLVLPLLDCTANNALLESMSCGLPIVSNAVGGIVDYTTPDFASLLPCGDIDGFVNAILELVENQNLGKSRGAAARSYAVEYLDWKVIAKSTLNLYYQISTL
jgi:glycosyltransferase involved in cell wall biosynthesis